MKPSMRKTVTEEAQKCIRRVFADRLTEEGFHSVLDNDICWYRVVNHEIIQSVSFYSSWNCLPLLLQVAYGSHPLFCEPYYSRYVTSSENFPIDQERFRTMPIWDIPPTDEKVYKLFAPSKSMIPPKHDGSNTYTFDHLILPDLERSKTIEQCYTVHKERHFERGFPINLISETFIDEVIYLNDTDMFQLCLEKAERVIGLYEGRTDYPTQKSKAEGEEYLARFTQLKQALTGNREEYVQILEQRAQRNSKKLRDKYHIPF